MLRSKLPYWRAPSHTVATLISAGVCFDARAGPRPRQEWRVILKPKVRASILNQRSERLLFIQVQVSPEGPATTSRKSLLVLFSEKNIFLTPNSKPPAEFAVTYMTDSLHRHNKHAHGIARHRHIGASGIESDTRQLVNCSQIGTAIAINLGSALT